MLRKREGCRNSTLGFKLLHYRYYYRISSAVLVIHLPTNFAEFRGTSPQTNASRLLIICLLFWRTLRSYWRGRWVLGGVPEPISQLVSTTAEHHLLHCGRKTANMVTQGCQCFFRTIGSPSAHPACTQILRLTQIYKYFGREWIQEMIQSGTCCRG